MKPGIELSQSSHEEEDPHLIISASNKRAFTECDAWFYYLYFSEFYAYDEGDFGRSYSVLRSVLERFLNALEGRSVLYNGMMQLKILIYPRIRVIIALGVLKYGNGLWEVHEPCEESFSFVRKSFLIFKVENVKLFSEE